jgi:hypothetical protein
VWRRLPTCLLCSSRSILFDVFRKAEFVSVCIRLCSLWSLLRREDLWGQSEASNIAIAGFGENHDSHATRFGR